MKTAMPQFLIAILIVCLASVQNAQATCQQGCLSNDNTVLGDDALISLTTGFRNTAVGYQALFSNTTSPENTAIRFPSLATQPAPPIRQSAT